MRSCYSRTHSSLSVELDALWKLIQNDASSSSVRCLCIAADRHSGRTAMLAQLYLELLEYEKRRLHCEKAKPKKESEKQGTGKDLENLVVFAHFAGSDPQKYVKRKFSILVFLKGFVGFPSSGAVFVFCKSHIGFSNFNISATQLKWYCGKLCSTSLPNWTFLFLRSKTLWTVWSCLALFG